MDDYLGKVKEKEMERQELDKRMQQDADLVYLKPFVTSDSKGHAIPDIVNVTLSKPGTFGAHIVSSLGSTTEQTIVVADKKSVDTHYIEEFQTAALNSANARLQKMGMPMLNPFADVQLCFRGRTARRVCFQMVDGVLQPNIAPWDGRYVSYEMGQDGLVWAGYNITQSKDSIEADYDYVVQGKTGQVLDVWDRTHNEVWIDGKKILEQPHSWDFCPVVLQIVPLGYGAMLMDDKRIQYEGESIFFLIRNIIPEMNRLVSILQTLNMKSVKPPMKYKNKEGKTAEPPEYEDATDMGAITALDPEGDIAPIDYGEVKQAAQMLYGILKEALDEGSVSSVDLGNLQFPLSAVALVTIGEGRDQIFLPRLQSKALLNQATAEMFTKQVIQIGGSVELGTPGHKKSYDTKKLEGEYETTYKYFTKSPKTDLTRITMADAAKEWYPRRHIYENVLQVEDVDGMEREWYSQQAEMMDPNVLKRRIIISLLEEAEEHGDEDKAMEAKIMATDMGIELEGIRAGIAVKTAPAMAPGAKPPIPLLPKGTSGAPATQKPLGADINRPIENNLPKMPTG